MKCGCLSTGGTVCSNEAVAFIERPYSKKVLLEYTVCEKHLAQFRKEGKVKDWLVGDIPNDGKSKVIEI